MKRIGRFVKTALSSPVEHFENKLVFRRTSCFLFTFWTWSELSFWILAENSSRFVQIAFLSGVERIGKKIFLSEKFNVFRVSNVERKNIWLWRVCHKLSKLHSICSRSRLVGTLISGENPNFLSLSGFNGKTSNLFKKCQTGLSELLFHVKKNTYREKNVFIALVFFSAFRILN